MNDRLSAELRDELLGVLRDSVQPPTGVFEFPWVSPSPFYKNIAGQWLWDAAYIAWGLARVTKDVATARGVVRNAVSCSVIDGADAGMLLHNPKTDGSEPPMTRGTSQTPVIAWLAARLHEMEPDEDFLRAVYPGLAAHVRWWRSARRDVDGDGLSEYAGPTAKAALHESGLDVAPIRDLLLLDPPPPSADGLVHDVVADAGLNALLYAECVAMAELAADAAPGDVAGWRQEAARIATAMQRMWCADVGAFMPVVRADLDPAQPWVTHLTPAVLLPVWAGVATPEQAEATVRLVAGEWREFPLAEGRARITLGEARPVTHGCMIVSDGLTPRADGVRCGHGTRREADGWHAPSDVAMLTLAWPDDRGVTQEWFTRISATVAAHGDVAVELTTGTGQTYHGLATSAVPTVTFGEVTGPPRQPLHGLAQLTFRARSPEVVLQQVEVTWARQRPRGLLSAYGTRSLHPLDGKFPAGAAPTHFWSGTVWAPYAWHACHALARAGHHALAVEQSRAFRAGVLAAFRQGTVAPEHLCDATGVGMGAPRQAWTAAIALLLDEELP
jgi:hypothetical protein